MRGFGDEPPYWAVVLDLSETYGIAPWDFEERCTPEWFHRMIMRRDEVIRKMNKAGHNG